MNQPYAKGKKKEQGGHSPYEPYKPAPGGPYVPTPNKLAKAKKRSTNNVNET